MIGISCDIAAPKFQKGATFNGSTERAVPKNTTLVTITILGIAKICQIFIWPNLLSDALMIITFMNLLILPLMIKFTMDFDISNGTNNGMIVVSSPLSIHRGETRSRLIENTGK